MANPTATAASTAFPPCRRMSRPTWLAIGLPATTIAREPCATRARPLNSQPAAVPAAGPALGGAALGATG